jgi:hypothetical protein
MLHLLLDFSPIVHLFISLELYSLSSDVLSSHNFNTLSFQSFFKCPFFPQFQHSIFPNLDLDLPFLEFPRFPDSFPLSFCVPLFYMFNPLPIVSPMFFRRISSLRITPTKSSNFKVFDPETRITYSHDQAAPTFWQ